MAETKINRSKKKQFGQFMTPLKICENILYDYVFDINDKILEPSFGCGNFIITIIDKFMMLYQGTIQEKLTKILNRNIFGVELDKEMFNITLKLIEKKYGFLPENHNLIEYDYLMYEYDFDFDYIIGNPPFGGTINPEFDVKLEKKYGKRGIKIKKETYSFFIIKSIENLKRNGKLIFISSDTFVTIKTMKGLRMFLYDNGFNQVESLKYFSDETKYPMVILTHHKFNNKKYIMYDNIKMYYDDIMLTDNFSWYIPQKYVKYFKCIKLSKYITGVGGMTIGKNELFLREIKSDNTIIEPYNFTFFQDKITVEKEIHKSRLNRIGDKKRKKIEKQELNGDTIRNVNIELKEKPEVIQLPNMDYCLYNKSSKDILYSKPITVIYWKDNGDACKTFKKNNKWYLHGIGGQSYFKREGIAWQLISSSIKARYLPSGYISDSGSPIAVLKENNNKDLLYFILGWLLTDKATELLKNVINHTKNIQSKDIEKLPYPIWVNEENKNKAIEFIKINIKNRDISNIYKKLNELYKF